MNEKIKIFLWGFVCSFAFAPFYLFFLFFFSFDFLITKLKTIQFNKKSFFYGWLWGLGYFIGNCYWLANPLTFEFPKYVLLIPLAITIVPAILACYIGFISFTLNFIRQKFKITNDFYIAVVFSALWGSIEIFRSKFFIPFPWNLIAYSVGFSGIFFQIVRLIGTFGFCFLLSFIYTAKFVLKNKKYIFVYVILIFFILIYGFKRSYDEKKDNEIYNLNVKIIQPNFSQSEKRDKTLDLMQFNELIQNINQDEKNSDLIVLPESTIPYPLYNLNENSYFLKRFKKEIKNQIVLAGVVNVKNNKIFNSLIMIKNGKIIDNYDKYYLAPFGEYIPFTSILPKFINTFIGIMFSQGKEKAKMFNNINNTPTITPIICYESLFSDSINKNAKIIINITNDIWFGKTTAAYQHFVALKFRAVENNISAIRAANSGISAYINKYGRVVKKTKLNEKIVLDLKI